MYLGSFFISHRSHLQEQFCNIGTHECSNLEFEQKPVDEWDRRKNRRKNRRNKRNLFRCSTPDYKIRKVKARL
ncbi:hypothetical protein NC652_029781 [Populus alba x Populus x berolinensis]|nr:hypothetical protein NC652_029781 [Populus alba x Populus x berolinensis]